MTSIKKTEQLIAVDAYKLGQGLKTAFEGVAMVFDSLGADAGFEVTEKAETTEKKTASKSRTTKKTDPAEKAETEQEVKDEAEDTEADTAGDETATDDAGNADVPADDEPETQVETKKEKPAGSTVSLDDVTKIIVQKIKQDRENNEKIGQILKTYGVAKVGELDADKYEAFLTDIAAL